MLRRCLVLQAPSRARPVPPARQAVVEMDVVEGNVSNALQQVQAAIERNPKAPELRYLEARIHTVKGDTAQSEVALRKSLELAPTYREAFAWLLHLNDKYSLDGRDPASYSGVQWCFGKFDRPFVARPVWGSIRPMSLTRAREKHDVDDYLARWNERGVAVPA